MASTKQVVSELDRLPRGRHGLSRAEVAEQQRGRILAAMIDVTAERGYARTRIVDVIGAAGVSRKTFYELFDDKEACFLEAFDISAGLLVKVTTDGYESAPEAPWAERVRIGLGNFLALIADRPAAAKFCIVECLAAGPKAIARRDSIMRQFTHFIEQGRSETKVELPGMTALALVGGVYELLYSEILHGATASLPARLPDVMYWVIHPFLGDERAEAERERARAVASQPQPAASEAPQSAGSDEAVA